MRTHALTCQYRRSPQPVRVWLGYGQQWLEGSTSVSELAGARATPQRVQHVSAHVVLVACGERLDARPGDDDVGRDLGEDAVAAVGVFAVAPIPAAEMKLAVHACVCYPLRDAMQQIFCAGGVALPGLE